MRIGGPITRAGSNPDEWILAAKQRNYSACEVPFNHEASPDWIRSFAELASKENIVIAEAGAWSNPIDPDPVKAEKALLFCQQQLALAEQIGARCCVNIAGSRNPNQWDGPDPENFSEDTFDLIVESVRKIVDEVMPTRTFYTLETMPWIFPASPDEYLALIKAIDRPAFAVHLDPVNMLSTPARAYRNADFLRECFEKLGPWIKSCHAKDIILEPKLTVHLNEARPGTGLLDYGVFLKEISKLGIDCPLFLEHLATDEEYAAGANYIREVAAAHHIEIH
jgi:sugar phosphate isomerase/epimerase